MKRVWKGIKEEAAHYWHGTKLLGKEIRISSRLLRRLVLGYALTRREQRQLKRTFADLLRLIPFVPFVIVPFAELLLPVAIKVFPNMLPSTFESKFAVEEKRRRLIKVRLEMAKFLQESLKDGGLTPQRGDSQKAQEAFTEFFRKVRSTGEQPSREDVIKVAKLFDDDMTLDNLSRPQLVSVCRYMQIHAFGTDNYLRYQVRNKLTKIRHDDMVLASEGTETLSDEELRKAVLDRGGLATVHLGREAMLRELDQWINLHLHERISGTLLILSKAFNLMHAASHPNAGEVDAASQEEGITPYIKSLELTLASLPDNLLNEAELSVNKDTATNKERLEVLEEQEDLIEDEAEQEQEEEEARAAEKAKKEAAKRAESPPAAAAPGDATAAAAPVAVDSASQTAAPPPQPEESGVTEPVPEAAEGAKEEPHMTKEQLLELGEALSLLSAKSSVLREREELNRLVRESEGLLSPEPSGEDEAQTVGRVAAESSSSTASDSSVLAVAADEAREAGKGEPASAPEVQPVEEKKTSVAARSLAKRVNKMMAQIDAQLEAYDRDVGSRMHIIEASPTGKISLADLSNALRLIKHAPGEDVIEDIVDKLDVDHDGLVPLADVLELAKEETGLGIVRDEPSDIAAQGKKIKALDEKQLRKADIVSD